MKLVRRRMNWGNKCEEEEGWIGSVSNGSRLPRFGPGLEPDRSPGSGLLPGPQLKPPGLGPG